MGETVSESENEPLGLKLVCNGLPYSQPCSTCSRQKDILCLQITARDLKVHVAIQLTLASLTDWTSATLALVEDAEYKKAK